MEVILCGLKQVYFTRSIRSAFAAHRLKMTVFQKTVSQRLMTGSPISKNLGANAIYFSPVFESDTHGYNTRDYKKIDVRLGTNEDFKAVCDHLHDAGIKVVLRRCL